MNNKKTPLTLCKLPLTIALSSIILAACNNTAPMSNDVKITKVPSNTSNNSQTRGSVAKTEAVSNVPASDSAYSNALLDDESLDELANLLEATNMAMVEDDKLAIQKYGNLWDRMRAGFAIDQSQYSYNPRIEAQKSWFTTRQDYINRLTARASRYLYHTVKEAERRNIPTELALLPVIESSYDPTATSNASAAGMWQFIPSTGRIYGLTQSPTYDGRRDVVESTRAAYDFLTSLYNQFGSWELALAAYNAGPGRIQRAIDANRLQGLPTDYWSLNLPKETMSYVPRFMAVAQIINDADRYGIYLPAIANRQHFRSVPVKYGVTLQDVSRITGVDYDELRMLNPALIGARVDIAGPNRIIIPNQVNSLIDSQLSQLDGSGVNGPFVASVPDSQYQEMSKSPEGLAEFVTKARAPEQNNNYIAATTTGGNAEPAINANEKKFINSQFASSNTLPTTSAELTSNATIIQEPPLSAEEKAFISAQIRSQAPEVGEVISSIDGNVKLDAIQTQQSILNARGQEKRLSFENPSSRQPVSTAPSVPSGKRSVYTVQRGDTLGNIASRAGLNWRDIADWNQINPNATLLAGTKLYLYNAKPIAPLGSNSQTIDKSDPNSTNTRANTYIVRSGDTLIGTANRVGLSVSQLARYNGLSTNARLKRGQKLWLIPDMVGSNSNSTSSTSSTQTGYNGKTQTYTVKRGDGLISLASRFKVPLSTLAEINNLSTSDELLIGQRLKVPSLSNNNQSSVSSSTSTTETVSRYTVKSGDTLIGIANKIGVPHTKIADLNNIAPNTRLQRGQTIKVPVDSEQVAIALNSESIKYKVQSGDSLIGLGNRFNVSVDSLAAANNLSSTSQLIKGKTITIPAKNASSNSSSNSSTSAQSSNTTSSNPESYKVKSGDSLIGLANKFGLSVSELAAANNISTNAQIQIGKTLTLPNGQSRSSSAQPSVSGSKSSASSTRNSSARSNTNSDSESYTVKSGDSLIGLANKYGLSTRQLATANGLSNTAQLQIGQKITIPATTTTYKVSSGDNLIRLAQKYGLTPQQFADLNGIKSDTMLKIGQVLKVPVK